MTQGAGKVFMFYLTDKASYIHTTEHSYYFLVVLGITQVSSLLFKQRHVLTPVLSARLMGVLSGPGRGGERVLLLVGTNNKHHTSYQSWLVSGARK